ncbi:MAG: hypothetical protein JOZ39_00445, partial [Chloroflexi bacterium]|nr:hypothetical protein [Chloroflexota bacterium]
KALSSALARFQLPGGEFPANVSIRDQVGHRRGDPEWDSQGEGIHSLVELYRYTPDAAWLRGQWPAIDAAAGWLERLVASGSNGLLPPGWSAEDLGSPDQQHFWDDFWGVIGLRDASFAAAAVGQADRAQQLQGEATTLLNAVLAAAKPAIDSDGIIPNGPDTPDTPAAARGTSPAVWPGQLLPDDLAQPVFRKYFLRFIVPYGGAFRHEDNNFWPFGGLELAHSALYLGMTDETNAILDWQLDHQTAKGVWAWGDEVSQDGSTLAGGDMPHGWTAAEYVDLVRDMLLYERGDTLQIAAGLRSEWLPDGGHMAVRSLPTYFGPVSYQLRRTGPSVSFDVQTSTPPPGGYDLRLPFAFSSATVDGSSLTAAAGVVHLPPSAKHVSLQIAP